MHAAARADAAGSRTARYRGIDRASRRRSSATSPTTSPRVAEAIDNLDVLLSTAFDAHLARIWSSRTTTCGRSRRGSAMVAVPTLIAGIYGMNFEHMPELRWTSATRSRSR